MVMEINSNRLATSNHAQLTAKEVGASTVLVPQPVVVEFRNGCIPSPEQPVMAALFAHRQAVLRKPMHAALNPVRSIVRATGKTGVSAPTVGMVRVVQNVDRAANKIEFSRSTLPRPQVDATATTSMATSTPDPVTCLAAQKIAKVPGVLSASVQAPRKVSWRWLAVMGKQKKSAVVEAQRQSPSPSPRTRCVVVNAARRLMAPSKLQIVVQRPAQLIVLVIGKTLVNAPLGVAMARQRKCTRSPHKQSMVERSAHTRTVRNTRTLVF
jgi:hypothetical protein